MSALPCMPQPSHTRNNTILHITHSYLMLSTPMRPLSIISTRRPGVATNNTILHTTTHSYLMLSTPMRPLSIISTRRPGVATNNTILHIITHSYLMLSTPMRPLSIISTRRPGVATRRWQPFSRSRIWDPMSAPPYTTQGRTRERYENWKNEKTNWFRLENILIWFRFPKPSLLSSCQFANSITFLRPSARKFQASGQLFHYL